MLESHRGLTQFENNYLTREEALVIEEAVGEGDASGVTNSDSAKVGDGGGAELVICGEEVEEEVVEEGGEECRGAELIPEVEGQGTGERGVGEDRGVEIAGEGRLLLRVPAGLRLNLGPDERLILGILHRRWLRR